MKNFFKSLILAVILLSNAKAENISLDAFTVTELNKELVGKKAFAMPVRGRPTGLNNTGELRSFIIKDILNWGSVSTVQQNGSVNFKSIQFYQDDFSEKVMNYIIVVIAETSENKLNMNNSDGTSPTLPESGTPKVIELSSIFNFYYVSTSQFYKKSTQSKTNGINMTLSVNLDFSH